MPPQRRLHFQGFCIWRSPSSENTRGRNQEFLWCSKGLRSSLRHACGQNFRRCDCDRTAVTSWKGVCAWLCVGHDTSPPLGAVASTQNRTKNPHLCTSTSQPASHILSWEHIHQDAQTLRIYASINIIVSFKVSPLAGKIATVTERCKKNNIPSKAHMFLRYPLPWGTAGGVHTRKRTQLRDKR